MFSMELEEPEFEGDRETALLSEEAAEDAAGPEETELCAELLEETVLDFAQPLESRRPARSRQHTVNRG